MGLTALAEMLKLDAANLGKVIEGKRKPSKGVVGKARSIAPAGSRDWREQLP